MNSSKPRRGTRNGAPDLTQGAGASGRAGGAAPDLEPSERERAASPDAGLPTQPTGHAGAASRPSLSSFAAAASRGSASDTVAPLSELNAPRRKRAEKSQARREAILAAALDEFTERGFAATRIDDVARRAGVGKGTIYLHFEDKEALFQQLVISMLGPVVAQLKKLPDADEPVRPVLERVFALFATEVYGTKRPEVLRLVLAEGPRFPHLAEFYYRHVVEPATTMLRRLLDRACARGEIRQERLSEFPQLVVAPALVAIIWRGLFDRFEPLDMAGLMRAHLDLLFGPGDKP